MYLLNLYFPLYSPAFGNAPWNLSTDYLTKSNQLVFLAEIINAIILTVATGGPSDFFQLLRAVAHCYAVIKSLEHFQIIVAIAKGHSFRWLQAEIFQHTMHATPLATLKPYLLASWAHEFGKREIYTAGESSPFPIAMRYGTHKMARDRLDLGGGIEAALRDTLDLYIQYDVVFAKEYSEYLIFTGFNKKF